MQSFRFYALAICLLPVSLAACGKQENKAVETPTTSVQANKSGVVTKLPFATFYTNPTDPGAKKYGLSLLDYDPCVWAVDHGPTKPPRTFVSMGMYLLNQSAGVISPPVAGTYTVGTPPAGATGQFIALTGASLGTIKECVEDYVPPVSGTVTLTQINNNVASGSLSLTLQDGTQISGNFGTAECTVAFPEQGPANDPGVCPDKV